MFQINNNNNNCCDTVEENRNVNNIQCCIREVEAKELQLNQLHIEKDKLIRQLNNASIYIGQTIKKHQALTCRFNNNYNDLKKKYQNKSIELNKIKGYKEFFNAKIDELTRKCATLECNLKEQYEKNKYLQEKNSLLENCINEDKQNITCLLAQLQNQKQCINKNSEEMNKTVNQINEKTNLRNKEKEEQCKLKSKIQCLENELSQIIEKSKSEICQLTKNIDCLKTEIEVQEKRNEELNQKLCEQNCKQQEQNDLLTQSNHANKSIKETMEKEKAQSNNYIYKLRKEKINLEKKIDDLEKKAERRKDELKKLEHKNEQLKMKNNELQCKLNTAIKNSGGYLKSSTEKIEKMYDDNKKLKNDITCKNLKITELEEKLLEIKKIHTGKADNVYNLKRQLDNVQYKQNVLPTADKYQQNATILNNNDNCQLSPKVLDELKVDCEHLTARIKSEDYGINDLEERNQMFEKLITKCISIINYF